MPPSAAAAAAAAASTMPAALSLDATVRAGCDGGRVGGASRMAGVYGYGLERLGSGPGGVPGPGRRDNYNSNNGGGGGGGHRHGN